MNHHTNPRARHRTIDRRPWRRTVIIAAALTGIAAMHGATADADARDTGPERTAPIWEQVAARQELRRIVDLMPADWPAHEGHAHRGRAAARRRRPAGPMA